MSKATKKGDTVRTTLVLSRELWRKARIRAAQDDMDLQSVLIAALERYLAKSS